MPLASHFAGGNTSLTGESGSESYSVLAESTLGWKSANIAPAPRSAVQCAVTSFKMAAVAAAQEEARHAGISQGFL